MKNCPTDEELERFLNGEQTDQSAIQAHIDDCQRCSNHVAQAGDRFNDLIRHVKGLDLASGFWDGTSEDGSADAAADSPRPRTGGQPDTATRLPPHDMIPGYRILETIHHGGQGVVFKALQESTKRKVAIKVLLEGPYASANSRRRFEREIELVAGLKHANIVSIFDSGETEDGRQYCVMDYVRGLPFDAHIKESKLTLDDALALFVKLCQAMNYAHQKGVIHRDLKPSNILVDSDGEPRILDFGLARQMVNREQTMLSMTGQVVGTLPYLSPEQAEGNPDKVDIRSDVYALGVVLYEMLTGRYPYPVVGQLAEVLNHITSTPATSPVDIWQEDSGIKNYSQDGRIIKDCPIDDEVQTIAMRALAKERDRRYQTAADLAQDIKRYLAGEPIEAKRDSSWYVLRKRVQQYKLGAAVGVAFLFVVIIALIATVSLWRAADRDHAEAVQARERAEIESNKARQAVAFTSDMLAGVEPETARGMDTRLVRMILDRAAQRVEPVLGNQPEVAASVYSTIGHTYSSLGLYQEAERFLKQSVDLFQRELGSEDRNTLRAKDDLANALASSGQFQQAEKLFLEVLGISRRVRGKEHNDTLNHMNNLASLYLEQGRNQDAEEMLVSALEIRKRVNGEEHVQTLCLMHNLANVYENTARYDKAESLLRKTVEIRRRVQGEQHPDTLDSFGNLALLLVISGGANEAEPVLREALESHRRIFGSDHPATLKIMNNLANVLSTLGHFAESEQLCLETLNAMKRVLGEEHPETLRLLNNLGNRYFESGRFELAEPLYRQALEARRRRLGENHPSTLFSLSILARLYAAQGRFTEAEPMLKSALTAQESKLGKTHPDVLLTRGNLADLYMSQQDFPKAEVLNREVLKGRKEVLGPDHANTLVSMNNLAIALNAQGKLDEAESIFRAALQRREQAFGKDHVETMRVRSNLILVLRRLDRMKDVIEIQRELLASRLEHAKQGTADAEMLNDTAWTLLTIEAEELRDPKTALELSERSNELSNHANAGYLDTLALAWFMTGDADKAVEWEEKAIALLPEGDSPLRSELEANLQKFRAARMQD